jgi:hypothetical protein
VKRNIRFYERAGFAVVEDSASSGSGSDDAPPGRRRGSVEGLSMASGEKRDLTRRWACLGTRRKGHQEGLPEARPPVPPGCESGDKAAEERFKGIPRPMPCSTREAPQLRRVREVPGRGFDADAAEGARGLGAASGPAAGPRAFRASAVRASASTSAISRTFSGRGLAAGEGAAAGACAARTSRPRSSSISSRLREAERRGSPSPGRAHPAPRSPRR